jgi:hypothetical protein
MAHEIAAATQKLALLIPRLGSPFEGERLATVAAIERVLKSHGLDWHDLAGAISFGTAPTPRETLKPERGARRAGLDQWRLDVGALLRSGTRLTDWERRFCASLLNFRRLSAKQAARLAEILQKHCRRAA